MTLAYLDSFAGLVPCRVLSIDCDPAMRINYIRIRITGRKIRAYKPGQILELTGRAVVPRHAVRGNRILPYSWAESAPDLIRKATP